MLHASQTSARAIDLGKAIQPAALLLGVVGFVMLALVASGQAYTELDVRIAGWVQGLNVIGWDFVAGLVNFLTDAPMAITLWLGAMTFLVLKGRPVEAIAVFLIIGLWVANQFISVVVDRPVVSAAIAVVVVMICPTASTYSQAEHIQVAVQGCRAGVGYSRSHGQFRARRNP